MATFKLLIFWLTFQVLAWYFATIFIFVAFVPFFYLLEKEQKHKEILIYIFILFWNIIVVFWLCEIHILKGLETFFMNSLVMCVPIWVVLRLKKRFSFIPVVGLLLPLWLIVEYLHHHWFLGFPWLTLGNVFGQTPKYVQWYTYTGVLGGSVWVLCGNYLIFRVIQTPIPKSLSPAGKGTLKTKYNFIFVGLLTIFVPALFSLFLLEKTKNTYPKPPNIIFMQTSWDNKVLTDNEKVAQIIQLITPLLTQETEYILLPEAVFSQVIWASEIKQTVLYLKMKNILQKYPNLKIIFGATLQKVVPKNINALYLDKLNLFYEKYNVAIQIDNTENIQIKYKEIFVPIDECVPFWLRFVPFESEFLSVPAQNNHSLSSFSNKINNKNQEEQRVFLGICYEMINSFFVNKYIKQEDKAILMLSSEGFMKTTSIGRQQYLNICRLRSIETQKYIIKSSYKGIACVISPQGELLNFALHHEQKAMTNK